MTEKEQLIEAWTAPLEDNAEQQMHARGLLEAAINSNAATLPAASKWMQHTRDQRKCRIVLWGLFLLALLSFLYPVVTTYRMQSALKQFRTITSFGMSKPPQVPTSTAEETFLLYGDLARPKASDQRRALWEREPQNAAFFSEYALHCATETGSLPADVLAAASELDPDNAWFLATTAALKSKNVSRKDRTIHPRSPVTDAQLAGLSPEGRRKLQRRIVHEHTILNAAAMQDVLDLWRQSLQKKSYESHAIDLHQLRYPILSQNDNFVSHAASIGYLFEAPAMLLQNRYLCDVLVTALQKTDMRSEEGQQLFRDVTTHTERLAATEPATLIDVLIARAILVSLYMQIDVIDTSALDPAMVETWKKRNQALQQLTDDLKDQPDLQSDHLRTHASMLTALAVPAVQKQTTNPLLLSEEDLKPMRYMEHSLILFLVAAVFSLLLLTLVPFHLWARGNKLTHRLSDAIMLSMPGRSLALLVLCSVVAPLLYFTALTVWTPLTGKDYGAGMGFLFPLYPAISLALMLLLLPRLLVHRFTATWQQLHPQRKPWYLRLGWTAFVLLSLPLHFLPTVVRAMKTYEFGIAFIGLCWLPAILWLLWTLAGGWFARGFYPSVMQGLRRRAVGVCTLCSIVLLALTCWALKQSESYWLQKDTVLSVSPEKPTLRYEAEITKRAHADWRGLFP